MMETIEYEQWWQLHLRMAKGETLSEEKLSLYNNGLAEQHLAEEDINEDLVKRLQQLRGQLNKLAEGNSSLHRQQEQLDQKIAVLESAYQNLTGQPITSAYATH